jgi:hypothetical protein
MNEVLFEFFITILYFLIILYLKKFRPVINPQVIRSVFYYNSINIYFENEDVIRWLKKSLSLTIIL